jgi:AP endonuclease-1
MTENPSPKSRKRTFRTEISPTPKRQKNGVVKSEPPATPSPRSTPKKKAIGKDRINKEAAVNGIKTEQETKNSSVKKPAAATPVKEPRKRKTKEEKEAEQMPLAERAIGCKILAGAHVSAAGGEIDT